MRTGRLFSLLLSPARGYEVVLRTPGVARFFSYAALGRIGVAMSPLAVLWAVRGATDSFAQAGIATGAFAITDALVGPQVSRAVDHHGQRRVVSITGGFFTVLTGVLALCCFGGAPDWLLAVLAGSAGAVVPPVGALSAARWRGLVSGQDDLRIAMSLEAVVNDLAFLVGPVLVTTVGAAVASWAGLALAGGFVAVGLIGLLTATRTEPSPSGSGPGLLIDRRLVRGPFVALLAANLAMGLFFGGIPLTISAFALDHHAGALAGPIMAVSSVVSLCAGLAYGTLGRRAETTALIGTSVILTVGVSALTNVASIDGMFLGYALVGGCVAPILIPLALLLQRSTEHSVYTQSMTWMNSASAAGIAIAAPFVGHLIQLYGTTAGFLGTAALTALLPLTLIVGRRVLRSPPEQPAPNDRAGHGKDAESAD